MGIAILLLGLAAAVTALPAALETSQLDPDVLRSMETTLKVAEGSSYDPYRQNVYHLRLEFGRGPGATRSHVAVAGAVQIKSKYLFSNWLKLNPTISQPILEQIPDSLRNSNYDGRKRTILCVHGYIGRPDEAFNIAMVPALLAAEDVNVIVVDWQVGAGESDYMIAMANTVASGVAVARFITWLNQSTGSDPSMFHLIGYSLGGQQVGVIGRALNGAVSYITALDPAFITWELYMKEHAFRKTDGVYTEVIHTGFIPIRFPMGHVDFYPNGGSNMPGCNHFICDHERSFYYLAESVRSGGFTGTRCENIWAALRGDCTSEERLPMGGLRPKTGRTGVYYLETNASPPFSRG